MRRPQVAFLYDDGRRRLHDAAVAIFADPGVDVLDEGARRLLTGAGADAGGRTHEVAPKARSRLEEWVADAAAAAS